MAGSKNITMVLVLASAILAMWAGVEAQSSCTNVIISLSPCLNYITGNTTTPTSQCCTQLASVVANSPQCLCQVLNANSSSLGINVNQTQALALPSACNVQTPPLSRCNASSPAPSPLGTPGISTPSGSGSNISPSTKVSNTSDGHPVTLSIFSLSFLLLGVSFATFTTTY